MVHDGTDELERVSATRRLPLPTLFLLVALRQENQKGD